MTLSRIENVGVCVSVPQRSPGPIRTAPRWLVSFVALFSLPLAATAWAMPAAASTSTSTPKLDHVRQKMAGLAVPFEVNRGQFSPEVAFVARTFAGTLFVTRDGKVVHALAGRPQQPMAAEQDKYAQRNKEDQQNDKVAAVSHTRGERVDNNKSPRGPGWSLVETLQGARELVPAGSQPNATRVNRFIGSDASQWHANIATFERVRLGDAWPGVSVELAARGSNVEKLFTVAPGTNPKAIRMSVDGANRLRLGSDGSLIATTGNGDVAFTPPVAFQDIGEKRRAIPVRYQLLENNSYRFETGVYDRSQPLVIDPLLQSTYLGGDGADEITAMAIDAGGNVLVAGYTGSINFPGTAGGLQPASAGGFLDAFVGRLSSNLTTLVQATYLGGSGNDQAHALSVDAVGNVLIAGYTSSTNFPGTAGGARPTNSGDFDVFVARLSSNLQSLGQATYLGGSGFDGAAALSLDAGGSVLVAGYTASINFPGTTGGAQSANGGGLNDAFVARLSSSLTTLVQATYVGGNGDDQATSVALGAGGSVLVAGNTSSTNLPVTSGGARPANGGGAFDGFVSRLSSNLTTLTQSTYLGGSGDDRANALLLDPGGNVLVAGYTNSTNFPATAGGAQATSGGDFNAFAARLSSTLVTLVQSTYLGGTGDDLASAMALDADGNVLVAGATNSTNFPRTTGCAQPASGGVVDTFVARLSGNLTRTVQATYLGGNGIEQANALALDTGGNVLLAGFSNSSNFPGTTGGAQSANGGGSDGFVAKLVPSLFCDAIFSTGFE